MTEHPPGKLIALRRPGHSSFILLWDFGCTPKDNLLGLARGLRGAWSTFDGVGVGCICDWEMANTAHWPAWFWHKRWWDRHVKVCPVPRDEFGNMIR
jgi:hypothetical protein